MWQPPLQGKSQQGQSDACHQPRLLPQLDLRNRILSVHLPTQCQRPVEHSLGESQGGASSAVPLPETSLLTVRMYRVGALPVTLRRCSVGALLVPYLSCFFSPRSLSSLSLLVSLQHCDTQIFSQLCFHFREVYLVIEVRQDRGDVASARAREPCSARFEGRLLGASARQS